MTMYKCKCGRIVSKSTNADNTGNRDTAGCEGCPYLLPWGPFQYVAGKGYVQDVQGYECRMSKDLEYATRFAGSITDKCSCYIAGLDFDFLARVSDWIRETYPGGELHGRFSLDNIRAVEYCSSGRYRMSITCAQNKKGIAAKAALLRRFFDDSGARLDMTPEEEKAHILAAIETGKAKAHKKEDHMTYKDPKNGWVDAGEGGELPEVCRSCQCRTCGNEECVSECWKDPKEVSDCEVIGAAGKGCADFQPKSEDAADPEPTEADTEDSPCNDCRCPECDDQDCPQAHCDKSDNGLGCFAPNEECPPRNPTCSGAAIAVDAKTADIPRVSGLADTTAAPVASSKEPTGAAPTHDPVGIDGSTCFDYSGLDAQTVADLHLAEREYAGGKKMAEMGLRRMADAVAIAHDAIVANCENGKDGKFTAHEDTFLRWCSSIGLKKDAAYRMLQVSKLMDNSTPREQKVLEELSPSLLYAAAKPSAPAELVQAVKDGDITTNKQYQEALTQLKAEREAREKADRRADAAERRAREAAAQHAAIAKDCNRLGLQAEKAEDRAKQAEKALAEIRKERDGARDALQAAKLRGDRLKEENEALKARPIEASVVDSDEVDRLVAKRVEDVLTSQNIRQQEEQEQAAQDAYDAFILTARSLDNLWQTLKPQVARLDPDQKRGAVNLLLQKLMEVKEDLIHVCENHAV